MTKQLKSLHLGILWGALLFAASDHLQSEEPHDVVANGTRSKTSLPTAKAKVAALGQLTAAPVARDITGTPIGISTGKMLKTYIDALDYEGKPTRFFALIEIPSSASTSTKVPGIVLVHGGGGSAFEEWADLWVARGYAAISIAVEGQTNERDVTSAGKRRWKRHAWAGPQRTGIYGDMSKPIAAQWMYHAVADTILANSLLRSLPEVADDKVGIMGISWGGVITSTVIGIDNRFAFAIPTYGCGHKFDSKNQYGAALGNSTLYRELWDPIVRLDQATMPVLWLSWPGDKHFPMDALAASYRTATGPRLVSLIPGMKHGHAAAWRPAESYVFADSIVRQGKIWARQTGAELKGDRFEVSFETTRHVDRAYLVATSENGFTGNRTWTQTPAALVKKSHEWVATATVPKSTTAWFMNLSADGLTASSDFQEVGAQQN